MSSYQSRIEFAPPPTLRTGQRHANIGRQHEHYAQKQGVCAAGEMMNKPLTGTIRRKLRSSEWFNNPHNPGMTALYLERYLNYGLTREELQSGKPIIGIAQTGNDLSPCNRHHLELAHRVREGIRAAGGIAMEFPMHPIQETGKRPTAALDRNLAYLGLVEILFGYHLHVRDFATGWEKTPPAIRTADPAVNVP